MATSFLSRSAGKGWYIGALSEDGAGVSTAWTSFWRFCSDYLKHRLGTDWCLSPEQSLSLHASNRSVPRQLLVRVPKGRNNVTILPHDTPVLEVRSAMPDIADIVELEGMRVFRLRAALVGCSARFFGQCPADARTALALIHDAQDILRQPLAGGCTIAGRLAGAFRDMGRTRMANDIVGAMRAAGFTERGSDPFAARAANSARARKCWRRSCRRGLHGRPVASNLPKRERVLHLFDTRFASESSTLPGYRMSSDFLPIGGGRALRYCMEQGIPWLWQC